MDTSPCYFCHTEVERPANAPHWTGSTAREVALTEDAALFVRVDVCTAQVCRDQVRGFPRAARRPKPAPVGLFGDYAQLAQMPPTAPAERPPPLTPPDQRTTTIVPVLRPQGPDS